MRQPLAPQEAAWWASETRSNPAVISVLFRLAGPISFVQLQALLENKLSTDWRFRSRIIDARYPGGRPHWEIYPHFSLSQHVHLLGLPSPGDEMALQQLISQMISTPHNSVLPLWQAYLIKNTPPDPLLAANPCNPGSALLLRIHHCLGDGLSLLHSLEKLMELVLDEKRRETEPARVQPGNTDPGPAATDPISIPQAALKISLPIIAAAITQPASLANLGQAAMTIVYQSTRSFQKLLSGPPDTPNTFRGRSGVIKSAAWSSPCPLALIKSAGKGTVTGLAVTALSGAIRRYLENDGADLTQIQMRMMLAASVHPLSSELLDEGKMPPVKPFMSHQAGFLILELPVGLADAQQRLESVCQQVRASQGSFEAQVAYSMMSAAGNAPAPLASRLINSYGDKATLIMTNVAGPPQKLKLLDQPVEQILLFSPAKGNIALSAGLISYAGNIFLSLVTDARLIPEPQMIISFYEQELLTLCMPA